MQKMYVYIYIYIYIYIYKHTLLDADGAYSMVIKGLKILGLLSTDYLSKGIIHKLSITKENPTSKSVL